MCLILTYAGFILSSNVYIKKYVYSCLYCKLKLAKTTKNKLILKRKKVIFYIKVNSLIFFYLLFFDVHNKLFE